MRIPIVLAPVCCRLEIDEALVSDVIDHEGRRVVIADLRECACGSPEAYELAGGGVTCRACVTREAVRERAQARRRRAHAERTRGPRPDARRQARAPQR